MKRMIQCFLVASAIFSACHNGVPAADTHLLSSENGKTDEKKTAAEQMKEETAQAAISNDISLETTEGVELSRAFLTFQTDEAVPASNITSLHKPIYLNLVLNKGWKEEMGEVAIGASQKISTDDGTVLLDDADLFDNYKSISAEDARFIKLKAVVNKITPNIKYFIVDYKVWDKNGKGAVTGSYRFYVQ